MRKIIEAVAIGWMLTLLGAVFLITGVGVGFLLGYGVAALLLYLGVAEAIVQVVFVTLLVAGMIATCISGVLYLE